ncbi:hypothetical protein BD324DRAFT_636139 [Kockovaella imperatae]|uniref:Uncharacterized protein n=1 Tax=Kockovaella imperatae TaxID=4999 RepID=A0A1Y1UAB8_9TREE|nr:hypothetical protein BD324DRAFT_636139 [Kockovaella imperatae]ORX34494.1 hypothetical protein BD324DRAFT_636139 [Kockovaella imperatae]
MTSCPVEQEGSHGRIYCSDGLVGLTKWYQSSNAMTQRHHLEAATCPESENRTCFTYIDTYSSAVLDSEKRCLNCLRLSDASNARTEDQSDGQTYFWWYPPGRTAAEGSAERNNNVFKTGQEKTFHTSGYATEPKSSPEESKESHDLKVSKEMPGS